MALALIEEEYLELVDALFPDLRTEMADSYSYHTPVEELKDEQEWHAEDPAESLTRYAPDLVAVADAVADLDVVVNGCGIRHGFDLDALGKEVFESNMRKLGPDGKPIYREDGKIIKPEGWQPPNIAGVLGI